MIEDWLALIQASTDPQYALAIAQSISMVKGYGDTYERGLDRYQQILAAVEKLPQAVAAPIVRQLNQAAQADEAGKVFEEALNNLSNTQP